MLSQSAAKQDIRWARDRHQLWNAAEAAEGRKDARVAREYEVALPHDLTKEQRAELSRAFVKDLANRLQCAVDGAIHNPHRHGDNRNYHAHLYATIRRVTAAGFGEKTTIERSDTDRVKLGLRPGKDEVTTIRERWAEAANRALAAANREERIDQCLLEAQGIDRLPTRHQGPAGRGIEARGERSKVVQRIKAEQASARLAKAAEIGRVLKVSRELRQSMVDLSGNVAAAKEAREAQLAIPGTERAKGAEKAEVRSRPEPRRDVDEIRRQARE